MIMRPQYGAANAVADIVGAIMQRNKERGDQKKQAGLFSQMAGMYNPSNDYTANQNADNMLLQEANDTRAVTATPFDQGLLSRPLNMADPRSQMFIDNANQRMNEKVAGTEQLVKSKPMANYTPNRNDFYSQNTKNVYLKAAELRKAGYDPKEFLPQLMEQAKMQTETQYGQAATQYQDQMLEQFTNMPNMDDKKAYMWAVRMKSKGLPVDPEQFAKMFAAKKYELLNLGDRYQAVDPYQSGTYEKGVSPDAVYNKNTVSADTKYSVDNRPVRSSSSQKALRPSAALTERSKHIFTLLGGDHVMGKNDEYGEPTVKEYGARNKQEFVSMVNQYAPELEELEAAGYDVAGPIKYLSKQWGI